MILVLAGAWFARERVLSVGSALIGSIVGRQMTSPEMIEQEKTLSDIEATQATAEAATVIAKLVQEHAAQAAEAQAVQAQAVQAQEAPPAAPPAPIPPTAVPFVQPTPLPWRQHQVQPGDTLAAIARAYDTDVETLMAENKLISADVLVVGRTLFIPPPPTPSLPPPDTEVYTVQAGDTLSAVARRYGIGLADLKALNPHLPSPDRLSVDTVLFIPVQPTPTPRPTATPVPQVRIVEEPTRPPVEPPPPVPTPTPTPADVAVTFADCPPARQESRVWGLSFCRPIDEGWTVQEWRDTDQPGVLIFFEDEKGVRSLYAISRSEGAAKKPLSSVLQAAQAAAPDQLARALPGGVTLEGEWQRIADAATAGQADQRAEIAGRYTLADIAARVRLIVFNHANRRWQVLMIAPTARWSAEADVGVFDRVHTSLEVFAP